MKVVNKRYRREFKEFETYEAGMVLSGSEVKSIKAGHFRLEDAFVKIMGNEAYLINAHIPTYKFAPDKNYDPLRRRKLLLHKKELIRIETKLNSGNLTVVPIACYNKDNRLKLEIAVSQGKKTWEIKSFEKDQDVKRDQQKELREYKNVNR
jgi:SsrA-binding protein